MSVYNFAVIKFKKLAKKLSDELHKERLPILCKPSFVMKIPSIFSKTEYFVISRLWSAFYQFPPFEKSSLRFLSIEYAHPKMEDRIPLKIDACWYIVGNELFMASMIMHLLEHQPESYHFDMNYTLHLMDNNIQMHTLTSDQYVVLENDRFFIQKDQMALY
jgi:hypothetical protein